MILCLSLYVYMYKYIYIYICFIYIYSKVYKEYICNSSYHNMIIASPASEDISMERNGRSVLTEDTTKNGSKQTLKVLFHNQRFTSKTSPSSELGQVKVLFSYWILPGTCLVRKRIIMVNILASLESSASCFWPSYTGNIPGRQEDLQVLLTKAGEGRCIFWEVVGPRQVLGFKDVSKTCEQSQQWED